MVSFRIHERCDPRTFDHNVVGGLTLPRVFTREKVNPLARVTLAHR